MKIKISSPLQLGTHFKSLRRAKDWSQSDLGKKLGISQSRVAQIESNPELISVDKLIQILHILDAGLFLEIEKATKTEFPVSSQINPKMNNISKVNSLGNQHVRIVKQLPAKSVVLKPSSQQTKNYRKSDSGRFVGKSDIPKNNKTTKW